MLRSYSRSRQFSRSLALAVLVVAPALLPAQQLTARDFLIPDSHNLVVLDMAAMRKLGVWDELESSVLNVAFARIEKEVGFPLDALDYFQVSATMPENGGPLDAKQVVVWQGNRELQVHTAYDGPTWQRESIGEFAVRRRPRTRGDEMFVQVRPELMAWGSAEILQPVLEGKHKAEPWSPDVQSLLSGREGRIAWLVLKLDHEMLRERFLREVMGADLAAWPEQDRPTHLSAQLLVTGDEDDAHVQVRVVMRHVQEGEGVAVSQRVIDAFVVRLCDDPRMRLIHPLLKKATAVRDHTDAVLQIDFGRSRDAVGNLAALLLPVLGRESDQAPVKAPAAVPAPADGGK